MKQDLRQMMMKKRDTITEDELIEKSKNIFETLVNNDLFKGAKNIMLYVSFKSEVLTTPIIEYLLERNINVYIPVTVPKNRSLIVSKLNNIEEDLELSTFGVLEPKKDTLRPIDPEILDLILVPGLVFDKRGYRIGYGAGYYDRFLASLKKDTPTISLAFDLQLIDHVPNNTYDVPVKYIITEKRQVNCTNH
ncbi:5-formyltetrahydrofolate cyclo-ligase [Serpentinicella sp. ANB-PHB4]|uniref:5-formyltetrahydrofolate cyclo-ligase n=1 Tax=Serpentinicella sp. ANB-PHB4 TaxID=3074076 RepID=UPI00285C1714|nr:5-formyltetrahydrofolate cyclo-ligase [Serpentinicella sp. ANB-PHB4]MDR5659361.1 5-formyltetrahydrofolate cyclo-ligase [Serpentinicella sp. ANB-PHB4]